MKIKISELTGAALDWAVATALGLTIDSLIGGAVWAWTKDALTGEDEAVEVFRPSRDWSQGGPIIERMCIGTKRRAPCMQGEQWSAEGSILAVSVGCEPAYGPTPLVAAMRCYVGSRMSSPVDVPEELLV